VPPLTAVDLFVSLVLVIVQKPVGPIIFPNPIDHDVNDPADVDSLPTHVRLDSIVKRIESGAI
jgi:hypothetical protein